jgi:hypothetical protein
MVTTTTRDDMIARLNEGIATLTSSERWTAWLSIQALWRGAARSSCPWARPWPSRSDDSEDGV